MPPTVIKLGDGTLIREHRCSCGKMLYKKNLLTEEVEIVVSKNGPNNMNKMKIKPVGDITQNIFTCAYCGLEHIVVSVKEHIDISEDAKTSLAQQ